MITLTPAAAEQIHRAAAEAGLEEVLLRVAARRDAGDGSIEYGMGFDDRREQDESFVTEGVTVLVSPPSREALAGTVLDFVELEPGDFRFIFSRPQDAADAPAPGGCGCGRGGTGCSR